MRKHIKFIKILCVMLCITIIAPTTFATTIDELRAEQERVEAEQAQLQEELDALHGDEEEAKKYQEVLAKKVILTQENIDKTNEKIIELNTNIKALNAKIDLSAEKYEETLDLLKKRIVSLYTAGNVSTLEALLNATSLQDFSMRTTAMSTVSEHDKLLMMKISKYAEETKLFREELAQEVELQKAYQEQLQDDITDLDKLVKDNMDLLDKLAETASDTQSDIYKLANSFSDYEDKIQALIQAQKEKEEADKAQAEKEQAEKEEAEANKPSTGTGSTGGSDNSSSSDNSNNNSNGNTTVDPGVQDGYNPCFPLPSPYDQYYWVTSQFGYRDGTYSGFHSGYDIAAPYGTPIYATQSGTVISAEYRYDWGNNVYIYHNDTYSTRSAHMSSMIVSAGDYVSKGQIIGYVGSTGQSTGNHIHFELWKNGTRIDPEPFLRG